MDKSHSAEIQQLILNSAAEGNILPITSRCDSRCVFCSHKNNPPDIDVISIGVRTMEEITETMNYLDPLRVITIGESASNIIEGEPFIHPNFREILISLRRRFPVTPIEITTNGHHMTAGMVDLIQSMKNISLSISINSASVEGRRVLMGDTKKQAEQTIAGIRLLVGRGVPYCSSLVAMPNLTGWDDIRNTIQFLSDFKAMVIRVYMPAFSSRAGQGILPDRDTIHTQLREFVQSLSPHVSCPVLLEPSSVTDLTPIISGVLRNSPAWQAGVRRGDEVRFVNGGKPRSRVEAWNMLVPRGEMKIVALKDGQEREFSWLNRQAGASGIIMEYDFAMERAEYIRQLILHQSGKTLLFASELGHGVVQAVLELMSLPERCAETVLVKNYTFGGTIKAAGLLTVDDYYAAYEEWLASNSDKPCQILIPAESFNSGGRDLKHTHYSQLARLTGVIVQKV